MKLCFFHLMPYQDLPDNFEKDYHSVWVDAPNSLFNPEKAEHMYNDFLDELEYAEAMGFDAVCVNEPVSYTHLTLPTSDLV